MAVRLPFEPRGRIRTLLIFGTRREAIKLAPVAQQCLRHGDRLETIVCATGQHDDRLAQITEYFNMPVDDDLQVVRADQTPADRLARCLQGLDAVLAARRPDCVVAQGDATTVMAAAVAAFYRRVPLVHVEAGLPTGDPRTARPDELHRRAATLMASVYCAATRQAAAQLRAEKVPPHRIHVTGNTALDALQWTIDRERGRSAWRKKYGFLADRRLVLISGLCPENFGTPLEQVCRSMAVLADRFRQIEFVYPEQLNPAVREPVRRLLGGRSNVHLIGPVPYPEFVWLMDRSTLILTDSDSVQEDGPALGKPVLVMRPSNQRPEAVAAGGVELVGTDAARISQRVSLLLTDAQAYAACQTSQNSQGDCRAAGRIVNLILRRAWAAEPAPVIFSEEETPAADTAVWQPHVHRALGAPHFTISPRSPMARPVAACFDRNTPNIDIARGDATASPIDIARGDAAASPIDIARGDATASPSG